MVLKALVKHPYEPMNDAPFRALSMKILFLVPLATAKRICDLQALSCQVALQEDDMLISYLSRFLAKTELESNPITREFQLRSLSAILGKDAERFLCSVRALRQYRHRRNT